MNRSFRLVPVGDALIVVQFEGDGDDRSALTAACAAAITAAAMPDVRDVVPTATTVGVYFDPAHTDPAHLTPYLHDLVSTARPLAAARTRVIEVPVCYGGVYGPDLAEVAAFSALSEAEVVALHTGRTYRVEMLGFAPGFAYLASVDPRVAMPRRREPRTRVPAGAVGIAARCTGIYPVASPGGWQIVGRTPLRVTDLTRPEPFLFAPGDTVRFAAIDADRFERLARVETV